MRILCTVLQPTGGTATRRRLRRRHASRTRSASTSASCRPTPPIYDRMSAWELVEYFGRLYGLDGERLRARMEEVFDQLADERLPRRARRQDEHRHEAEGVDRPGHHPRPAGADLRRADRRPRRAGGPRGAARTSQRLRDQGKCILFSTHIMREVEKLCDRVAIIAPGPHPGLRHARRAARPPRRSTTWRSCSFSSWPKPSRLSPQVITLTQTASSVRSPACHIRL